MKQLQLSNYIFDVEMDALEFNELKLEFDTFYSKQFIRSKPYKKTPFENLVFSNPKNFKFSNFDLGLPSFSYFLTKEIYDYLISNFQLPQHEVSPILHKTKSGVQDDGLLLVFYEDCLPKIDFQKSSFFTIKRPLPIPYNEIPESEILDPDFKIATYKDYIGNYYNTIDIEGIVYVRSFEISDEAKHLDFVPLISAVFNLAVSPKVAEVIKPECKGIKILDLF